MSIGTGPTFDPTTIKWPRDLNFNPCSGMFVMSKIENDSLTWQINYAYASNTEQDTLRSYARQGYVYNDEEIILDDPEVTGGRTIVVPTGNYELTVLDSCQFIVRLPFFDTI